ncbi:MAG: lysoplasmalogenase family protein [Flavobacteriaceae bacterium]
MRKQLFCSPALITFCLSTLIIVIGRILSQSHIYLIFIPLVTMSLLYHYHKTIEDKDQSFYFILVFCLLGDIIITLDGFYSYTSGLMAYWGASVLFYFTLYKELKQPLKELFEEKKYYIPFLCYGVYFVGLMIFIRPYLAEFFIPILIYAATLSFTVGLSFVVYMHNKTESNRYFMQGLFILSVTASLMGLNRFVFNSHVLNGLETLLYAPSLFYIYLYFKTKPPRDEKNILS